MSEQYEERNGTLPSSTADDQQLGAAGATGTRTANAGSVADWVAQSVAIRALGNTCVKSGSTLNITMLTGGTVTITRSGANFNVTGQDITDPTCGGATVNNIDLINLVGSGLADTANFDFSNGLFEPGLTAEGTGTSEIEINMDMNGATDTITITGTSGDDSIYVGDNEEINYNAAESVDDVDFIDLQEAENLTMTGGDGSDTLWNDGGEGTGNASTFDVTVNGGNGRDFLAGSTNDDTLSGGAGSDVLKGGNGTDAMDGGTESDLTSYVGAGNVTVNLATGLGSGGHAAGDTYASINDVVSGGGDDTLTGDGNDNLISGGAGNDTIKGGGANDSLLGRAGQDDIEGEAGDDNISPGAGTTTIDAVDGGADKDTLDYGLAANAVTVDLAIVGNGSVDATGNQNTVGNGSDDIRLFEQLRGTNVADTLRGDGSDNFIFGWGGGDLIEGRAGLDKLSGGAGDDTINGDAGDDIFHGGAGAADVCNGGADNDDFSQDEGTCETENQ